MSVVRRVMASLLLCVLAVGLSSCTGADRAWTHVPQRIAGGFSTGVYYDYGLQLAKVLTQRLGAPFSVLETNGSIDNLRRIGSGEAVLGFAQGDAAADAIAGRGAFDRPLPIRAVARVYDEYVHVVVRADSPVRTIADLAGRSVSLGAEGSGVELIAGRILSAAGTGAGLVSNPKLGLDGSIDALRAGTIDGFFWVGGLPTPGIERLAKELPIRLLSIETETVERVNEAHDGVYRLAEFPMGAYGIAGRPAVTMTVPTSLVASADAPDDLVHDTLRVLFESRSAIAAQVPAAALLDRRQAIFTSPIELHPGAARYYQETRR